MSTKTKKLFDAVGMLAVLTVAIAFFTSLLTGSGMLADQPSQVCQEKIS